MTSNDDELQTLQEAGAVDRDSPFRGHSDQRIGLYLKEILQSMREQTELMQEQTELLRAIADEEMLSQETNEE